MKNKLLFLTTTSFLVFNNISNVHAAAQKEIKSTQDTSSPINVDGNNGSAGKAPSS